MNNTLRIVLVDDNPDDRALVIRELCRSFPAPHIVEVTDSSQFQALLENPPPDLVISDYQLRWTDGLAVLRSLKSRWPDIPVIMFTGTGSEEIAVEAMKAGLDDYVLKSPRHYSRLPASSQVALTLAQQRRQLKHAEQRYSNLFNSIPVGLYAASPDGQLQDANPALIQLLGFPDRDSLLAANMAELHANPDLYREWRARIERQGVVCNFETQWRCRDGRIRWFNENARVLRDSSGQPLFYEGSLEDITERKQDDEEREKLILELQDALAKIKTLSGLLPICAACKKIRDDKGYWNQIEVYIETHSDAEFTHSFCPDCVRRLYPEVLEEQSER